MFVFQLREYCLRLRNMVASDATKDELSDAVDTMIEEVRLKKTYTTVPCRIYYIFTAGIFPENRFITHV